MRPVSAFSQHSSVYALVAAAGIGSRMQSDTPKQYLTLADDTVIGLSIERLLKVASIKRLIVSVAENDQWWPQQAVANLPAVSSVVGGANRSRSVLAGLEHILTLGQRDDWVLVHDAARPLVRSADIERLIQKVAITGACGGILATPATDTIKLAFEDSNQGTAIRSTPAREALWQAQTPQFFPVGVLCDAITAALDAQISLTDEASAMEAQGYHPLLVQGHADNIKITQAGDLSVANLLLSLQN